MLHRFARLLVAGMLPGIMLLWVSAAGSPVLAHDGQAAAARNAGPGLVLGKIDFPTSAKDPEAQAAFMRGMLLLHLFEYPHARAEFLAAQEIEPDFAMAYWGEAMTHNHPIWDEQDLNAAREVLVKLSATPEQRQAVSEDPKEQAYLGAVEVLYGEGTKAERDHAYARAMENMAMQFPDDPEVKLFHALAVLGLNAGVRDIPSYMHAAALAQDVFSANPEHPGAAHYLIHGVDDPDHAVLGLTAARALYRMAPDAGHSLHMTSHIFVALGMWQDVVTANENAVRVQNLMRQEQGETARHWGHYNSWLLYGLLQLGREEDALKLLKAAYTELQEENKAPGDRMILDPDRSITGSVVQMWARYLIETRDWDSAVSDWTFKLGDAFDPNLTYSFVQGMRSSWAGDASKASQYLGQFRTLQDELSRTLGYQEELAPGDEQYLKRVKVMEQELVAAIEFARGENQLAARIAAEASRLEGEMPYAFGPPFVDWPSAELEGEMLVEARKYADAEAAYKLELKRARLRSFSLEALAGVLEKQGKAEEAAYYRNKLDSIRQKGDGPVGNSLPVELEEN
jgi:hypothetical protein